MSNFFRGVSADQDGRYKKADEVLKQKMTKAGKFSDVLETKVDMAKVNVDVISRWVSEKITEILGFEDEIVVSMIVNVLHSKTPIDPKKLQIDITGFLVNSSKEFMEELWTLMVDAQSQPSGIPSVFIQRKREEILSRSSDLNRNSARNERLDENNTSLMKESAEIKDIPQSIVDDKVSRDSNDRREKNRSSRERESPPRDSRDRVKRRRDDDDDDERRSRRNRDDSRSRRDRGRPRSRDRDRRSRRSRERNDSRHRSRRDVNESKEYRRDRDRRDSRDDNGKHKSSSRRDHSSESESNRRHRRARSLSESSEERHRKDIEELRRKRKKEELNPSSPTDESISSSTSPTIDKE